MHRQSFLKNSGMHELVKKLSENDSYEEHSEKDNSDSDGEIISDVMITIIIQLHPTALVRMRKETDSEMNNNEDLSQSNGLGHASGSRGLRRGSRRRNTS